MYLLELAESVFGEYSPFCVQVKIFLEHRFYKQCSRIESLIKAGKSNTTPPPPYLPQEL